MKKEMKILGIILISVILMSLVVGVVAAQVPEGSRGADVAQTFSEGLISFINGIKTVGDPLFRSLFGTSEKSEELFVQILAFLLVMLVVYGILSMTGIFGGKPWINMVVGAIVAILGIRFLPEGFLEEAAIPSSAFVAILVMGIPFVLLGYILQQVRSSVIRRAIWVAYGVLILILWVYNIGNEKIPQEAKWVYPLILLGCIIAFWFDGTLQRWWGRAKAERTIETGTNVQRNRIIAEIRDLEGALASAQDPLQRNQIKQQIADKKEALKSL